MQSKLVPSLTADSNNIDFFHCIKTSTTAQLTGAALTTALEDTTFTVFANQALLNSALLFTPSTTITTFRTAVFNYFQGEGTGTVSTFVNDGKWIPTTFRLTFTLASGDLPSN
jgi:hypothetical protein